MRFCISTSLLVVCASLAPINAVASNYYVRVSGDDSNTGLAPALAFATIKKAAKVAASGDNVYVGAGTYTDEVTINGIQQSNSPARFIADVSGTYTGDGGDVVISAAAIAVVNCNYVELQGFQFQGAPRWFLVWKGSYEGLVKDCVFTAGNEPLLIRNGSVRFENCQLTDFVNDAVLIDGNALVTLLDSTISGGQEEGIEVRKTSHVVLDNTTIENNIGDGIKIEHTTTTVDDGGIGDVTSSAGPRLAAGRYRIQASGGMFDGYNSDLGDYATTNGPYADLYSNTLIAVGSTVPVNGNVHYGPSGSATVPTLTGTISQMTDAITMDPVDTGDAATNNNNANIPLTDNGNNPLSGGMFMISLGDGVDLPPGTYYFTNFYVLSGAQVRLTGPTTIYVTGNVVLNGGSVLNPSQKPGDFKLSVLGAAVTIAGTAPLYAAIYAPNARITKSGSIDIYGMAVGNEIIMSGTGGIHVDTALTSYAAAVQGITSSSSSPLPVGWTPSSSGELDVSGSTLTNNANAVRIVTAQAFNSRYTDYSNNTFWGLYLTGSFDVDHCTISNNGVGGIWMNGVQDGDFDFDIPTIVDNLKYGIYLEDCQVTLDAAMIDQYAISGSEIVLASQGSSLTLSGLTVSGGSVAGVASQDGTLTVLNSTFSGNGYGISAVDCEVSTDQVTLDGNSVGLSTLRSPAMTILNSIISNNSSWGAMVTASSAAGATATFSASTVENNGNGISVTDAEDGDFELLNSVVQNNTQKGLHFTTCNLTLNDQATANWQLLNNGYGISGSDSTLTLDGVTITGASLRAVSAVGGDLTVRNSTLSGSEVGLYADQNTSLLVTASTLTGNTTWGAVVNPSGSTGLSAIFDACTIHSNAGGITINNATDGQVSLRSGTVIRDNTSTGLHYDNCNLTVNDQSGGTAWSTIRNHFGISSSDSTLVLDGVVVADSTSNAIHSTNCDLTVRNCSLSGRDGIYAMNNSSTTVDATHLVCTASGVTNWGIYRQEGDLVVRNCVLNSFENGIYLETAFTPTAKILNCTVADTGNNGIYVADGPADVVNTIVVGNSGQKGIVDMGTDLTHSYNLVQGFTLPFYGTAAAATDLQEHPRFVDGANGNYHLATGSPAINAGVDLGFQVPTDMDGNARPAFNTFEIGAYEYTSANGSFRVLEWKETE